MSRTVPLAAVVVAGLAIVALSFVDAWIVHYRLLDGEGYRNIVTVINAWQLVSVPLVSLGVVAAGATALVAAGHGLGARLPGWLVPVGAALTVGLLGAVLAPVAQQGHASRIDLRPDWAGLAAVGLAVVMLVAALWAARPRPVHLAAIAAIVLVLLPATAGGRWVQLQLREGSNEAWADGSYTLPATGDRGATTLVIENGRYRIGERMSGTWESSGWTVMLDNDPACDGARGTYHAHGEPTPRDADLRFVKVVDTCDERVALLESGIWVRDR